MNRNIAKTKQKKQTASTLATALIIILLIGLTAATAFRGMTNESRQRALMIDNLSLKQFTSEAFELVKRDVFASISYFNRIQDRAVQQKCFELYKNDYRSFLINSECNEVAPDLNLQTQFIDWARNGGYRGFGVLGVDDIKYEFSVRCIKDGRLDPTQKSEAYANGSLDGCPISARSKWKLNNQWNRLPKKIELKVRVRVGDQIRSLRSLAEIQPVTLSDYALAFGDLHEINCEIPFTIFGGHFYGRFHSNQSKTSCPDGSTYYLRTDTSKDELHFWRPFTTSGLDVDVIARLNKDPNAPPIEDGSTIKPIYFHSGYSTQVPPIDIDEKIRGIGELAKEGSTSKYTVATLPESNCRLTPNESRIRVECPSQSSNIRINPERPTVIYSANDIYIKEGIIDGKVAFVTDRDAFIEGSIRYKQNPNAEVFIPEIGKDATDPISVSSSSGSVPALKTNLSSAAMISANHIVLDPSKIQPLVETQKEANGRVYGEKENSTLFELQQVKPQVPLSDFMADDLNFDRVSIIDAKLQARSSLVTMGLNDYSKAAPPIAKQGTSLSGEEGEESDSSSTQNIENLGNLVLRGGINSSKLNPFKEIYKSDNGCSSGCVRGWNNVSVFFDSRDTFRDFPGSVEVKEQMNWISLTHEERVADTGLFGVKTAEIDQ